MSYLFHLLTLAGIYSILGVSLNLIVGYTGLVALTHGAFYGIGAYAVAFALASGWSVFFALSLGAISAGGIALLLGIFLSRFRGDYYILASFGSAMIAYAAFLNLDALTGGPLGLSGILRPSLFGISLLDARVFLLFVFATTGLIFFCARFLVRSSFGRVLMGIREDEEVLRVFGYSPLSYKLIIFVVGAAMAGIAGGLYAIYVGYIDPTTFTIHEGILVLSMIILGGLASLRGSLLGACLLVLLPEFLRFVGFPDDSAAYLRQMTYGLLLVLFLLYRPKGFLGEYKL